MEGGLRAGVPAHVLAAVRRRVRRGGRVLEAGCGMGNVVFGLAAEGWACVGLDWAQDTVSRIRAAAPALEVLVGDVRALPFADASFDAVVSQGVIEHFREGYAAVLDEMARVLKPGGVAIVGFPAVNALRRLKARCGAYPTRRGGAGDGQDFYQFALDPRVVEHDLAVRGFVVRECTWYEGLLGVADETPGAPGRMLRRLYNDRDGRMSSALRRLVEPLCARPAGYCHQIVACRGA